MKSSNRMTALAQLVTISGTFADIGTDHGYLPIYLIQQKRVKHAIAMDINAGPLERARQHVIQEGLQDKIQLRLSDGLSQLQEGEADVILIAGMGGGVILHILKQDLIKAQQAGELILQPQSEIALVRSFLCQEHFQILQEEMIAEDGKYYPMMKVRYDASKPVEKLSQVAMEYGPLLLLKKNPVLKEFLEKEQHTKEGILAGLAKKSMDEVHIRNRYEELTQELERVKLAQQIIS